MLRARWIRHRCRKAPDMVRSTALISPVAPSLMTSSGQRSPRAPRSVRNPPQASPDSLAAVPSPTNTGWPSVSMPQPASTGSAASESGDAWGGFLTDLGARGLRCPLLVISDGATGLISAVERTMSGALRQRCLIHRARNILAKVPKNAQAEVKADYWAIFEVPDTVEPGPAAVRHVQNRIDSFARRWRDSYPAAVRCLLDGRDNLTVYLRFPREHWNRIRHSNFIERTFGETRRRVKVIGRLPGEHSCTSLVWAVLDRASRGWPGPGPPRPARCSCARRAAGR